jgi:DNA gyrase/topoisomerase IV subunit B
MIWKRYNNIVIATDADVDGMHIRLLLITFPSVFRIIKKDLYILQTPLFRVQIRKKPFTVILKMNDAPPSKIKTKTGDHTI